MIGLSPSFTQTVFVYLCICVFVFVYLVIQDSSQTNWNFLLPVRFLQLFCWGTLNGLKSVESIFPLSRSYFIFLRQTGVHWIFNFDQSQTCWDGNCFCKQTFSIFLPVFVVGKPSTSSQKHNFIPFASFAESLRKLNYISMVVFFHQELSIYTIYVAGLRPLRFSFYFLF